MSATDNLTDDTSERTVPDTGEEEQGAQRPSATNTRPLSNGSAGDVSDDDEKSVSDARTGLEQDTWLKILDWKWELLACAFSVMCMATIIGILSAFQGQSLRHWRMLGGISPNAVISLFGTTSKSAMLLVLGEGISHLKWIYFQQREQRILHLQTFDNASRGPWGAMILLRRLRWRASLAAGGAILVLLALAFDPFAQQVLSFPLRKVQDVLASATIPRAGMWNAGSETVKITSLPNKVALDTYKAIITGIYAPNIEIKHTCATGNCTWTEFNTLAVCSKCANVTSAISRSCVTICENCNNGEAGPIEGVLGELEVHQDCTYTFPTGQTVHASAFAVEHVWTVHGEVKHKWQDVVYTPFHMASPMLNNSFLPVPGSFVVPGIFARTYGLWFPFEATDSGLLSPASGFECDFSWCVETHGHTTSTEGVLSDYPTRTQALEFPARCSDDESTGCLGFTRDQVPALLKSHSPSYNWTDETYERVYHDPNAWIIGYPDNLMLQYTLSKVLTTPFGPTQRGVEHWPDVAYAIARANDGNVSKTMADIARAITLSIRQGPNSTAHHGTAYKLESVIKVNWSWLILPLTLVILSSTFLAACMLCEMEHGQSPWKSSSLALLFHGLCRQSNTTNNLGTEKGMEETARETFAQLDENDRGLVALINR